MNYMKIFDFNNRTHVQILKEELSRAKRIMEDINQYSTDEIWAAMPEQDREDVLLAVNDDDGPDIADQYMSLEIKWDDIPSDIQDLIDLSAYELASRDQSGRTMLRGIDGMIKNNPEITDSVLKLVNKYCETTGRELKNLTRKQATDLNIKVQQLKSQLQAGGRTNTSNVQVNPRDYGGGPSKNPFNPGYTGD